MPCKKYAMFLIKKSPLTNYIGLLCFCVLFSSCVKSGYQENIVYNSDFKSGNTRDLTGAVIWDWKGEKIIGRYNNGGFDLKLNNLPKHTAIEITAIPYFHDSWDGNTNVGGIDGPDIWQMQVDGAMLVNASFSNTPCNSMYCLQQSYPMPYSFINNPPLTGAVQTLPSIGNCSGITISSVYKIVKTITHHNSSIQISFRDHLVQTNVPDPLCDESWSMGGLVVKIINTP